jgi:hypothetical protein
MTIEPYIIIAFVAGCIYAAIVHFANAKFPKATEGWVWLEVVIGVSVTLLVATLAIGWTVSIPQLFIAFAATGAPMAAGSLIRYGWALEGRGQREEETVAKG